MLEERPLPPQVAAEQALAQRAARLQPAAAATTVQSAYRRHRARRELRRLKAERDEAESAILAIQKEVGRLSKSCLKHTCDSLGAAACNAACRVHASCTAAKLTWGWDEGSRPRPLQGVVRHATRSMTSL